VIYLVIYLVRPPVETSSPVPLARGLADLVHEEAHPVFPNLDKPCLDAFRLGASTVHRSSRFHLLTTQLEHSA